MLLDLVHGYALLHSIFVCAGVIHVGRGVPNGCCLLQGHEAGHPAVRQRGRQHQGESQENRQATVHRLLGALHRQPPPPQD